MSDRQGLFLWIGFFIIVAVLAAIRGWWWGGHICRDFRKWKSEQRNQNDAE